MEPHKITCLDCGKAMLVQKNGQTVEDTVCLTHGIKSIQRNHCRTCCPN